METGKKNKVKTKNHLTEEPAQARRDLSKKARNKEKLMREDLKQKVTRLDKLYSALSKINNAIVKINDPVKLSKEICRISVEVAGFRMVWIGLNDPVKKVCKPVAHWGHEKGYLKNIEISLDEARPRGRGPSGIAARGKISVCNDFTHDPRMKPWRKDALKRGYLSSAAFPISAGKNTIGAFTLYASEPNFFSNREVRLIKGLSANIYFALEAAYQAQMREAAEKELQSERDLLTKIHDRAAALMVVFDREGRIFKFNRQCERTTGYTFDEVKGKPLFDIFLVPEEAATVHKVFNRIKAKNIADLDNYWLTKDGRKRLISWKNNALLDAKGRVEYLFSIGIDITEQRVAEEALKKTAQQWSDTFDSIPDVILLIDNDHRIIRANKAASRLLGTSLENIIGCRCYEAIHGAARPHALCPHAKTLCDGIEHVQEVFEPTLKKDFLVSTTPMFDHSDKPIGSVHVMRNITARKQIEEDLQVALGNSQRREREQTALLAGSRAILENHDFNEAAKAIFTSCKNLIGARAGYVALLSADGKENDIAYLDSGDMACKVKPGAPMPIRGFRKIAYRTGKTIFDNRFQKSKWLKYLPKGHVGLENVLFAPLIIEGKPVGLLGLGNKPGGFNEEDARMATAFGEFAAIALRNSMATQNLENSEKRLRAVAESAPNAHVSFNAKGKIVFWNRRAEDMFGYSPKEAQGMDVYDLMPKKTRYEFTQAQERLAATGESWATGKPIEFIGIRKNGSGFPVELFLSRWETAEGSFFTTIISDITERKQVEEELRNYQENLEVMIEERTEELAKSEHKWRNLFENMTAGVFRSRIDGSEILDCNQKYADILGYTREELIGHRADIKWADKKKRKQIMKELTEKGQVDNFEAEVITKSGEIITLSSSVRHGSEAGTLEGFVVDITARKRAEEALQRAVVYNRSLIESSIDPLVTIGPDGRITDVNLATEGITGCSRSELIGTDFSDYFTDPDLAREAYRKAFDEGFVRDYELEVQRRDGYITPVLYNTSVYKDEKGNVAGVFAAARDISERKRAEEQIQRLNEFRERVIEDSTIWINVLDNSGNVLVWNKGAEEMSGYSRQEVLGRPDFRDLLYPEEDYRNRITEMAHALLEKHGKFVDYPVTVTCNNGKQKVISFNRSFMHDDKGVIIGSIELGRDITDQLKAEDARKEAERAMEEQRTQAIHADRLRSLGEMAAGMAHELNQPLLGVRGLAEHIILAAERGWDTSNEKVSEKIKMIVEQADRMSHIIEHARMFAREAQSDDVSPVQVNEVVNSCIGLIGAQLKSHGYLLDLDLSERLPLVLANPFSLEEVVLNLISNSRDAMEDGKPANDKPPTISLRTFKSESEYSVAEAENSSDQGRQEVVCIEVSDNGSGIAPNIMDRIFDPFFTTKEPGKGTGLGLPICKKIIEGFKGKIEIKSFQGHGATVTISIPAI